MITKFVIIPLFFLIFIASQALGQPTAYTLTGKIIFEFQNDNLSKSEISFFIDTINNVSNVNEINFDILPKLLLDTSRKLIIPLGTYWNIDFTTPNCNMYIRVITTRNQIYYFKLTGSLARIYSLNSIPPKPGKYLLKYDSEFNECSYQKVCHTVIPMKSKF